MKGEVTGIQISSSLSLRSSINYLKRIVDENWFCEHEHDLLISKIAGQKIQDVHMSMDSRSLPSKRFTQIQRSPNSKGGSH